jgi:hypothetical protein
VRIFFLPTDGKTIECSELAEQVVPRSRMGQCAHKISWKLRSSISLCFGCIAWTHYPALFLKTKLLHLDGSGIESKLMNKRLWEIFHIYNILSGIALTL